jgi:hypothetical protein
MLQNITWLSIILCGLYVIHPLGLATIHRQPVVSTYQKCIMLHKEFICNIFALKKTAKIFITKCVTVLRKTNTQNSGKISNPIFRANQNEIQKLVFFLDVSQKFLCGSRTLLYDTIKCAACTQNMTSASSTVIPTVHGTLFHILSMYIPM